MTEDKPKRGWFQFHLTTAVLMMLLFAIIFHFSMYPMSEDHDNGLLRWYCGWPYRCIMILTDLNGDNMRYDVDNFVFLVLDVCVLLFTPLCGGIITEFLIRRREVRKT